MKERYFVISNTEERVPDLQVLTKEELEKYLQENLNEGIDTQYLDSAEGIEFDYFPNYSTLIIKGTVIAPKVKEIVKKMEIE